MVARQGQTDGRLGRRACRSRAPARPAPANGRSAPARRDRLPARRRHGADRRARRRLCSAQGGGQPAQGRREHDPGQFVAVAKDFEHRVDADAALTESNRAHQRRYLQIGEPVNGLARIDGQLIPEAAATIRSAMERYLKPAQNDERTPGQRAHDALVELCRRSGAAHPGGGRADGASPRPQLIIKVDLDTLAGIPGAPAGRLERGGTIPAETVRRMACDAAIIRITGLGELEREITHEAREPGARLRPASPEGP
ncbi:MAG: DUF222 domain-containing protein [Chloroflexi bacterium]|nr:MAG: DUF222 domain-containing protein [Chloroflexota bacterium]